MCQATADGCAPNIQHTPAYAILKGPVLETEMMNGSTIGHVGRSVVDEDPFHLISQNSKTNQEKQSSSSPTTIMFASSTDDSHDHHEEQPIMLCTGVLVTTPPHATTATVNLSEFRNVASAFGFMLGLLSMAADMGIYAAVRGVEGGLSVQLILTIMAIWSIVISIATWLIYCLVRRMVGLVSKRNADVLRAMERCCLLWSIIGLTGGYCAVDFFLLPPLKFFISVAMSVATVGVYQFLLACIDHWELRNTKGTKEDHVNDTDFMIL
ncbi:hypothetical protein MHU86_15013 [Fragilaria crotonensis]|nr:hypothetical protein MHU86_15013 [Fragilaria crotonensis]